MAAQHFDLIKTNSLIFRGASANAQLIIWRGFRIFNESKLNLVDPDHYRKPIPYLTFLYINYIKRKRKRISGDTLWVLDLWAINYYHWIVEALPKILSTRLSLPDVTVVLPESFRSSKFHEASPRLLQCKVEFFNEVSECVVCDRLILPLSVSIHGTSNPVYMSLVQSALMRKLPTLYQARKRVYVSRSAATKRRIVNEDAVSTLLRRFDFEIVSFESMSLEEQISSANQSSILLGLHGAGLTNMIFMRNGSVVVELSRPGDDNKCYEYLAQSCRHMYHSLECFANGQDLHICDFTVDIDALSRLLVDMLAGDIKIGNERFVF